MKSVKQNFFLGLFILILSPFYILAQTFTSSPLLPLPTNSNNTTTSEKWSIYNPGYYQSSNTQVAQLSEHASCGYIAPAFEENVKEMKLHFTALNAQGTALGNFSIDIQGSTLSGITANSSIGAGIQKHFFSQVNGINHPGAPNFGDFQISTLSFSLEKDVGLQRDDTYMLEVELVNQPRQLVGLLFSEAPARFNLSIEIMGTDGIAIYQAGIDPQSNWYAPGSLFTARNPQNGEASLVLLANSRQQASIASTYTTNSMIWIEDINGQAIYYSLTHYLNIASLALVLGFNEDPFLSPGSLIQSGIIPSSYIYNGNTYHIAYWSEHTNGDILAGSYTNIEG